MSKSLEFLLIQFHCLFFQYWKIIYVYKFVTSCSFVTVKTFELVTSIYSSTHCGVCGELKKGVFAELKLQFDSFQRSILDFGKLCKSRDIGMKQLSKEQKCTTILIKPFYSQVMNICVEVPPKNCRVNLFLFYNQNKLFWRVPDTLFRY